MSSATRELATQPTVVVSAGLAVSLVLLAALNSTARRTLPATFIVLAPLAVAGAIDRLDPARYVRPVDDVGPWASIIVAATVVAVAVGVFRAKASFRDVELTIAMTAAAGGIFACVPETDTARLLVGPALAAMFGVVLGVVKRPGPVGTFAFGCVLAAITLVDGQQRGSAVVGGAACLAIVALVLLIELNTAGPQPIQNWGSERWTRLVIIIGTVAVCSRVAGIHVSTVAAAWIAVAAVATGGIGLWMSTQLSGERAT